MSKICTFCWPNDITSWGSTWFYTTASAIFSEKLAILPNAKAALFWIDTVGSSNNGRICFNTFSE